MDRNSLPALSCSIWTGGLRAVEPGRLISLAVKREGSLLHVEGGPLLDLDHYDRVHLAALGKAAVPMALRMAAILGPRLTRGIVLVPPGVELSHPRLDSVPAAHPLPDLRSVRAAKAVLSLARKSGPRGLFLVLISGGASAQLCLPARGVTLSEKRALTRRLLLAGADIFELNAVRKHLSAIKGGRLAAAAYPARVLNLVLSDVRHNDLETIASGPTHWDSSTYAGARDVLKRYGLWPEAPAGVRRLIVRGIEGKVPETLKRGDSVFSRVRSVVVGDIRTALRGAADRARRLGFESRILDPWDQGEARDAARLYVSRLRSLLAARELSSKPVCFLAGGELSVTVRGRGRGGRNTEFILAALGEVEKARVDRRERPGSGAWDWLFASLGTDGRDGQTDAAGAWVDAGVAARAARLGLDPDGFLDRNDSYSFFLRTKSLIRTGPTGTNVMDLRLFLLAPALGGAAERCQGLPFQL